MSSRTTPRATSTIELTIDGRACVCVEGTTVLAAARAIGIAIPTLCDDPRLEPTAACRLCLVAVTGVAKPVAACSTLVSAGMEVQTSTPALTSARLMVLECLARDYPAPGARAPANVFEQELAAHGVVATGEPNREDAVDVSHPYIRVDMAKGIDCFRCIRICHEVQGQDVWHLWDRGMGTVVHPAGNSLRDSPCVACGACVDTCPSGALTAAVSRLRRRGSPGRGPSARTAASAVSWSTVPVKDASWRGEVVLPTNSCSTITPGQVFATFHGAEMVNTLTSALRDPIGTPEYKVTAVRLEVR